MAVWLFKRRSSSFVAHQALQAFIFQAIVVFFSLITGFPGSPIGWVLYLVGIAFGSYAAYRCQRGEDFQYPVLGNLIASIRQKR